MLDFLKSIFYKDTSEISGTQSVFLLLGILALIAVFAFFVRTCYRLEIISGKPSFSVVKIIMIAAAPTVFSVLAILNVDVPFIWFGIITAVMCVAVLVWNVLTYGILGGLMFTVVHIVFGVLAGLGIAAFVFIAIAAVALALFAGGSTGGSSSSSSVLEYVRDPSTGEIYDVEKGVNGELYIAGTSNVLRKGDYSGEYIDSYGNRYII